MLHEMQVVQPLPDGLVVASRGNGANRTPVFGIGPRLVRVQFVEPVIHRASLLPDNLVTQ